MSISLTVSPPALSFSADLISAKFSCVGFLSQVGVKSVNEISGVATHSAGTVITIRYGSKTVVMTAATSPDDSGNQYLAYNPLISVDFEIIAEYFRTNYNLSKDFYITTSGTDLIFTAKVSGLGFDFLSSPGDGLNTTVGVPEIKQPNYTVLFNLWLENPNNTGFDLIYDANLQLLPNSNGIAEAPIGDKLHVAISKVIRDKFPEQPDTTILKCKNSCRRYYFEFAESYGDPITVKKLHKSATFTVLHGGLSTIAQYNKTALGLLAPNTENNDRFLKQGSNIMSTRTNQPQYLYFFNTRASRTVSIKANFTFTDGTTHMETIAGVPLDSFRKYAFNASFLFLYANPVAGKIVSSYKVYLLDGADRVSEEKTYILDYSNRNFIRCFLNWSSFGALDSRITYGKGESEFELSYNSSNRIPQLGDDIRAGKSLTFGSKLTRTFKVATGWINRTELVANADFYLSNLKYRFTKDLMLPIQITSNKINEIKDGENLLAQLFEYRYLIEDHAYTEGDAEEAGISFAGFSFGSGFIPGSGSIIETDPTVGTWIKAITPADIARWNASVGSGGATLGDWFDVLTPAAEISTEDLKFQFKTDSPNDANKVITYIAGLFTLDSAFVGTTLLIGKLPDGSRPYTKLKEWFVSGTTEIYLVIDTNGDISLESKDGFDLPTGTNDEAKYFINLNYKPKPALVAVAGKWVVDITGTSCEPGQTGYQLNTLLKRVSDDVYEQALDVNDNYCTASGLAQATMATSIGDPLYRIYNSGACTIASGKWIIDTTFWRCDPANLGYRIFERMLRVSNNIDESPYDANDDYCSATGLPQATSPTPTSATGYSELNATLCPIGGGGGGSDVDFTLAQYGRRLRLSGPISISCTIVLTVTYNITLRDEDGIELSHTGPYTDTLNLNSGTTSVSSPSSITAGPYDTIDIIDFTFTPKYCGSHQVFVNGQEGEELGEIE